MDHHWFGYRKYYCIIYKTCNFFIAFEQKLFRPFPAKAFYSYLLPKENARAKSRQYSIFTSIVTIENTTFRVTHWRCGITHEDALNYACMQLS